jgi:hypothetical protein
MNNIDSIQEKKLPCYECLCLPACRGKDMRQLMKCELAYNYLMKKKDDGHDPYDGYRHDLFLKFMRTKFS